MSVAGQLNAIFRFCAYYAVIMVALTKNLKHAFSVLVGAMFTYAVQELAYDGGKGDLSDSADGVPRNKCTEPTKDNPYMNLRVFDPNDKSPACKQWAMGTKSEDVMGEPIQDSPFQRPINRFYTMPNTQSASKQSEFARWLYGGMPSKSRSEASGVRASNA